MLNRGGVIIKESILGVKIRDKKTGLFMLRDGRLSKNGKTYSTLGFAKTSITNKAHNYKKYLDYEFVVFKDNATIEIIPVKEHIIDLYTRCLEEKKKSKKWYESMGYESKTYLDNAIDFYTEALKELNEEGI